MTKFNKIFYRQLLISVQLCANVYTKKFIQICDKMIIKNVPFYQGQFKSSCYFFHLYTSLNTSKANILLLQYIGGDLGSGSAIKAFDFAGSLTWNIENNEFDSKINKTHFELDLQSIHKPFPSLLGFLSHSSLIP